MVDEKSVVTQAHEI
jgi:hypothetical protein